MDKLRIGNKMRLLSLNHGLTRSADSGFICVITSQGKMADATAFVWRSADPGFICVITSQGKMAAATAFVRSELNAGSKKPLSSKMEEAALCLSGLSETMTARSSILTSARYKI
jgi:hypothetical protein